MRHLFVVRGAAGSGKTHFIRTHGLEPFATDVGDVRLLLHGVHYHVEGDLQPNLARERDLWGRILTILEDRMLDGQLIVLECNPLHREDVGALAELARRHHYDVVEIDFTDVHPDLAIARNAMRPAPFRQPDYTIERAYARYERLFMPRHWRRVLSGSLSGHPLDLVEPREHDLDQYETILVIGDIHGCHRTLMHALEDGLRDDTFYLFLGDYIDRGPESGKVVRFLSQETARRGNIALLWGNHEDHLHRHSIGLHAFNEGFRERTVESLRRAGMTRAMQADFCAQLLDAFRFRHRCRRVVATHGGLTCLPDRLSTMPSYQLRKGMGRRDTPVDALFSAWSAAAGEDLRGIVQVHGHRNLDALPVAAAPASYNLEGRVEAGGALRLVRMDASGIVGLSVAARD